MVSTTRGTAAAAAAANPGDGAPAPVVAPAAVAAAAGAVAPAAAAAGAAAAAVNPDGGGGGGDDPVIQAPEEEPEEMEVEELDDMRFLDLLSRLKINDETRDYLILQGIDSLGALILLGVEEIGTMATTLNRKKHPNGSQIMISQVSVMLLKVATFWAIEQDRTKADIDPTLLTSDVLQTYSGIYRMEQTKDSMSKASADSTTPDKLKNLSNWPTFLKQLENQLSCMRGAAKCPLSYVIRDVAAPTEKIRNADYATHDSLLVALTDLSGYHYEADNKRVFEILKALVVGGPGEAYVELFDHSFDGRGAVLALKAQCDGVAEMDVRAGRAHRALESAVYKGESRQYDFAKHVSVFQMNLNALKLCDEEMNPSHLNRMFLNSIQAPKMEAAIALVRASTDMRNDFQQTQRYLAQYAEQTKTLTPRRGIGALEGGRGGGRGTGKRGGRGGGKGGGKPKGGKIRAGNYSAADWRALSDDEKDKVRALRKAEYEKKNKRKIDAAKTEVPEESESDSSQDDGAGTQFGRRGHEKKAKSASQAVNGTAGSGQSHRTLHSISRTERLMDLRKAKSASQAVNGTAGSGQSHRTLHSISRTERLMDLRKLCRTKRSQVRCVENRSELDSHADTCCAGANTVLLERTGVVVNVKPFADSLKSMKDVPIASCATAFEVPDTGEVIVLVLHEALYFGERLDYSLWNPNQLRSNGLKVEDAPRHLDKDSSHSIYIPDNELTLKLKMHGVMSYLPTRKPTREELDSCTRIDVTNDTPWEPYSSSFEEQEEAAEARDGMVIDQPIADRMIDYAAQVPIHHDEGALAARMIAAVNIFAPSTDVDELKNGVPDLWDTADVEAEDEDGDEDMELSGRDRQASSAASGARVSEITPEVLARRWGTGLETAKRTLRVTTQKGVRYAEHPLHRRFRTRQSHLRYPVLKTQMYTDTMFATRKGLGGHKCAQVYVTDFDWIRIYPMKKKSEAGFTLEKLIQDVGIPNCLFSDGAAEETGGKFKKVVLEHGVKHRISEPYSPWMNRCEQGVKATKRGTRRATQRTGSPKALWPFCSRWYADIRCHTAHDTPSLDGRVPEEMITGNTPDIATYLQYDWYQYVWYLDQTSSFPDPNRKLGRWCGVSHGVGQALCFWILNEKGRMLSRSTVQAVTADEFATSHVQELMKRLDAGIAERLSDSVDDADIPDFVSRDDDDDDDPPALGPSLGHEVGGNTSGQFDDLFDRPEADDFTPDSVDNYLTAKVMIPRGDEVLKATVKSRKKDRDGNPIGRAHSNPILDSREYELEFPDGTTETYAANVIAENIYAQVDDEGFEFLQLKEIIDHRKDGTAVSKDDMYVKSNNGQLRKRLTTKGWELLAGFKDGSTTWVPLRNLKESNPIELAEYAVANKLVEEPAFAWWVKNVLRQRDRMLSKVKSRYWSRTHKFGIELPKSVEHALRIDAETGTDYWKKAIEAEMKTTSIAFEFVDDDKIPPGYKDIEVHMVFDIKSSLARKARLCAGGHKTEVPKEMTYSSVVTRESVRIAFLLAALNDLEVVTADIKGAYLFAKTKEKVYVKKAGKEFGSNAGRPMLIVRALYGLKSSGKAFRQHLAAVLEEFGFKSNLADPDVWLREATRPDGTKLYEMVLTYVDDVLACVLEPNRFLTSLRAKYTLKESSVGPPKEYLGATVSEHYIEGSDDPKKRRWAMSSDQYLKSAIADVETELAKIDKMLSTKVTTPMSPGYRPEVDFSAELPDRKASYYQQLIGILRWGVELGRIDILVDVSMLSSHLANPREGHLDQVFHIFGYLKRYNRSKMVFDDTDPELSESRFKRVDWSEFYPGAKEAIPPNAPEPRGKPVTVHCFVDASHAGCQVTRRSQTGVIIFVNRAPILWFSKRQNTVESSTFSSEFVAMRLALELVEGLRYKLRMFGVPLDGPANMFCDNEAVVKNTTAPESTLKKKHVAICYHRIREAVASGTIRVAKEDTKSNLADLATKCLPGPKLREMVSSILW